MLEAKYLNVENTERYRPIIRLFYLKYEKLKYWLYQEAMMEIYLDAVTPSVRTENSSV